MTKATEAQTVFEFAAEQNYRDAIVPKPIGQVDTDWAAFIEELYALRNKYRIPDVLLVAEMYAAYEDGHEGILHSFTSFGDPEHSERLAAFALGQASALRQERVAKELGSADSLKRRSPRR